MTKPDPFYYFKTSRETIRLAVMMHVRFPLSLRNVEGLLYERGVDVSHEAVRYWRQRVRFDVCFRDPKTADCRNEI
jgi:putative transposase